MNLPPREQRSCHKQNSKYKRQPCTRIGKPTNSPILDIDISSAKLYHSFTSRQAGSTLIG